ncbi:hypothetical protein Tco_1192018 [Tanacetum coccineum]
MLSDIEDNHGPSDAMHNPSQPLKVGKTLFQNSRRFTHFYQLSHSELVDIEKVALSSSLRSLKSKCTIESRAKKRSSINLIRTLVKLNLFNTTAGNPVKKILLKLNLSDHRLCKMVVEVPDSSWLTRSITTCSYPTDKHLLGEIVGIHEKGQSLPKLILLCYFKQSQSLQSVSSDSEPGGESFRGDDEELSNDRFSRVIVIQYDGRPNASGSSNIRGYVPRIPEAPTPSPDLRTGHEHPPSPAEPYHRALWQTLTRRRSRGGPREDPADDPADGGDDDELFLMMTTTMIDTNDEDEALPLR